MIVITKTLVVLTKSLTFPAIALCNAGIWKEKTGVMIRGKQNIHYLNRDIFGCPIIPPIFLLRTSTLRKAKSGKDSMVLSQLIRILT